MHMHIIVIAKIADILFSPYIKYTKIILDRAKNVKHLKKKLHCAGKKRRKICVYMARFILFCPFFSPNCRTFALRRNSFQKSRINIHRRISMSEECNDHKLPSNNILRQFYCILRYMSILRIAVAYNRCILLDRRSLCIRAFATCVKITPLHKNMLRIC